MNTIIRIIMERDGLTRDEAESLVSDVKKEIDIAMECYDWDKAEDLMLDYLELEPEYILDLLED